MKNIFPIFFQDEATDIWIIMQKCHWYIWLFLIFIFVFVLSMFFLILLDSYSRVKYVYSIEDLFYRYTYFKWLRVLHLSDIEFIWTTLPCFVLFLIGVRSIYTLYVIDTPLRANIVVKAMGRQWFWQYELAYSFPTIWGYSFEDPSAADFGQRKPLKFKDLSPKYFDSYMVMLNEQVSSGSDRRNLKVDTYLGLVPGLPIRILTTGMDVLHSFAIPSFGVKLDAVGDKTQIRYVNRSSVPVDTRLVFDLLDKKFARQLRLNVTYRLPQDIVEIVNKHFYKDDPLISRSLVKKSIIPFNEIPGNVDLISTFGQKHKDSVMSKLRKKDGILTIHESQGSDVPRHCLRLQPADMSYLRCNPEYLNVAITRHSEALYMDNVTRSLVMTVFRL